MDHALVHAPACSVAISFDPPHVTDDDRWLHAGAAARAVAGTSLVVGAAVAVAALFIDRLDVELVLVASWMVAIGAWALVRCCAPFLFRYVATGRALVDDKGFGRSWAVLLAGLGLVLPLSSHLAVTAALGSSATSFEGWAAASALLVGHVHLLLAILLARRALWVAAGKKPVSKLATYAITTASSAVPGVFLFGLPILLVALTGLLFLPVMAIAEQLIARERLARVE